MLALPLVCLEMKFLENGAPLFFRWVLERGTGDSGEPFYVKYTLYLSTLYHQIDLLDEIIQSAITMLYVAQLFSLCASSWTTDSCRYCLVLFIVHRRQYT